MFIYVWHFMVTKTAMQHQYCIFAFCLADCTTVPIIPNGEAYPVDSIDSTYAGATVSCHWGYVASLSYISCSASAWEGVTCDKIGIIYSIFITPFERVQQVSLLLLPCLIQSDTQAQRNCYCIHVPNGGGTQDMFSGDVRLNYREVYIDAIWKWICITNVPN